MKKLPVTTLNKSKYVKQIAENLCTLFLMLRARLAYFKVFNVSTKSQSDGDMQAIIVVLLFCNKNAADTFHFNKQDCLLMLGRPPANACI